MSETMQQALLALASKLSPVELLLLSVLVLAAFIAGYFVARHLLKAKAELHKEAVHSQRETIDAYRAIVELKGGEISAAERETAKAVAERDMLTGALQQVQASVTGLTAEKQLALRRVIESRMALTSAMAVHARQRALKSLIAALEVLAQTYSAAGEKERQKETADALKTLRDASSSLDKHNERLFDTFWDESNDVAIQLSPLMKVLDEYPAVKAQVVAAHHRGEKLMVEGRPLSRLTGSPT